ncbi:MULTISPECIES: murein biosynthesis integral membrane protein MurJ [Maribacter]|uniref:Lipid II flippase MurJ n=1 Tax=Maribacter flavus TaxID=1658664 RepID=A0ABU7IJE5_9FLAO|nr:MULTISPECIES: lipid II flippase MurJ [Maribacter]MDC6405686.1 lipid II flippase MurJ [Maribacter sp. PR66]MEE1973062.1 lipid II flippase MurJ [Maribacter flavus]
MLSIIKDKILNYKSKKVLQNIFLVSSITLLISILGFFKEAVIAAEYGLSLQLDTFFVAIIIPGLVNSVFLESYKSVFIPNYVNEIEEKGNIGAFQSTSFIITLGISILFIIICILSTDIYLEFLFPNKSVEFYQLVKKQFYIILPSIIFWGLSSIIASLLYVNEEYRLSSFSTIFTPLIILTGIFLFKKSLPHTLLAWGTTCGAIISFFYLTLIGLKKKIIILDKLVFKNENIRTTIRQLPAKVSSSLMTSLNSVIDQFFAAQLVIGSITALNYGQKIPAFITSLVLIGFSNVLLPYFSKIVLTNRAKAFSDLFKNLKWMFLVLVLFSFIGILMSDFIVSILFERKEFTEKDTEIVSSIQQIFMAYIPFRIAGMIMVNFATSINKNSILAYISLVALALNLILDYIFIQIYGIIGIALCTTIVIAMKSIWIFIYLRNIGSKKSYNI